MSKNRENNAKRKLSFQPKPKEKEEDWCFECKDGGQLVFCDHKKCGKVYHQDCLGKDESFFDTAKSWVCARHYCFNCIKPSKFCCLGCPNSVCKKCVFTSEFTVVRGVQGLCCDCVEIVEIIEKNLEHDSEGTKITLNDRETYECLFKEYWENVKVIEGLTDDDISSALSNYRKGKDVVLLTSSSEGEEEKQNNCNTNEDYRDMHKRTKRKKYNSMTFVGWASEPLFSFLASIGKYKTEPMTQWAVRTLIIEYIKKKNLYHPKDNRKFLPDQKLFPIFKKKTMSINQIYSRLEFHFAKELDYSAREKTHGQSENSSADKSIDDQICMERKLSNLIAKPLLKKGDLFIKPGCFASIHANNIAHVYLKRSLVLELSKRPKSFVSKVVGTFVRARVNSNDHKQRNSYHLVRVLGVVYDEMSNGILLQVSFIPNAIPISELSDDDFTEQECEDLQQKVKAKLLPKLNVGDLQEKATSLHKDITKHWIATRLVYLRVQIERANLRGRTKEKIALLEEREELEQPWKQEQLLKCVPTIFPEFVEAKYNETDEDEDDDEEIDSQED